MGTYTQNLNLYNTNMQTDGNDTFDFQRDINDNNDKIDTAVGKLSNLTTTQKANLVSAINEIVSNLDGKSSVDLNNLSAVGQAIIDKKVEVEALLAQNGYAKFSWKQNNQISNLIIQWGRHIGGHSRQNEISGTITFPTSFNEIFSASATGNDASDIVNLFNLSNYNVGFGVYERYSEYLVYDNLFWFAIGK